MSYTLSYLFYVRSKTVWAHTDPIGFIIMPSALNLFTIREDCYAITASIIILVKFSKKLAFLSLNLDLFLALVKLICGSEMGVMA